jgi:hypothetical protein
MKRSGIFALAAIASVSFAAPAMAAFVKSGSVDVGYRMDKTSTWTRFGGPMEGLRLEADRSDIKCRSIVAHFANGTQQNVFSGQLRDNRPILVDVRGGERRVRDVTFNCRSDDRSGGKIYLEADVGRYQDEWRRSPDWTLFWSKIFNWAPLGNNNNGNDPNYWVTLGRTTFQGRNDVDSTFTGWNGRSTEKIGLRAVNDDARCSRVRVNFGNGSSTMLNVGRLDQGRREAFDLPGGNRNVRSIDMRCRAINRNNVTIEILGRK